MKNQTGVVAALLVLLSQGCLDQSWKRTSGFLDPALGGAPLLGPDSVEAGRSFTVTVRMLGPSSCTRADGTELRMRSDTAEIVAHYLFRSGDCTADMGGASQSVTLRFDEPGDALIRLRGPERVFDHKVTVHPVRLPPVRVRAGAGARPP